MSKKLLIILLIIIVAGGAVIGGTFAWQYWQMSKQEEEPIEYKAVTIKELISDTAKYDGQKILVRSKFTDMRNRPIPMCVPIGTGENPEIKESYHVYPATWGISNQDGEVGVDVIDENAVHISTLPNYQEGQKIELRGVARATTVSDYCNYDVRHRSVYIEVNSKDIDITLKPKVTITTDKTEYEPGETIKTTTFNGLDFSIYADHWKESWIVLHQYQDGKWNEIFSGKAKAVPLCQYAWYPGCPYFESLQEFYDEIRPSQSVEWSWDQKILQRTEKDRLNWYYEWVNAPHGKYKVEFGHFYTLDPDKREWKKVYSNEFTIKEKTTQEVTITTDKTEYEQREIIEMNLVNPLASPVYYYWNGWPGSSWWSIYRLNEVEDTWEKIETNCTLSPGAIISCDGKQGPFWDPGAERCLNITSEEIKWEQKVCEVKENYCPTGSKVESYSSVIREPAQSGRYKFVATYQQDSTCKTELETLETQFIIK